MLCYQLAKRLHGSGGRFTSIDDSGGGDGVEFYLTLPNGDQWGWQIATKRPHIHMNEGALMLLRLRGQQGRGSISPAFGASV